jgi:WD40 repeat protein
MKRSTTKGRGEKRQKYSVVDPNNPHIDGTPISLVDDEKEVDESKMPKGAQFPKYTLDVTALKSFSPDSSDKEGHEEQHESNDGYGMQEKVSKVVEEKTKEQAPEVKRADTPDELKEEDTEVFTIHLKETETFTLLHIPARRVGIKNEDWHKAETEMNEYYSKMCEDRPKRRDKFSNASAQTFTNATRDKISVTDIKGYTIDDMNPPQTEIIGANVSTWDIYDAFRVDETEKDREDYDPLVGAVAPEKKAEAQSDDLVLAQQESAVAINSVAGFAQLPNFRQAIRVVEEAVLQNAIHSRHLLFRKHPDAELGANEVGKINTPVPEGEAEGVEIKQNPAHLVPLWSYRCELTRNNMPVTCVCWNKKNPDLMAAGYGLTTFGNTSTGLILFWTLKNPTYPQKIIRTTHTVTSLDFSTENPHLLAVGLYDGSVCIYDIREPNIKPDLQSQNSTGKHTEPVWEIKWVQKENGLSQILTSISSDGKVNQWSMKKGLVPHTIMELKRIPNLAQLQGHQMPGTSREASGLCFDSAISGPQYFVGTEDGLLHKCSTSYNRQTLENYYGHTGPVYKVRCSPIHPDAFLSCSADWTIGLWSQKLNVPVHKLQNNHGQSAVMDVQWSPTDSCVFACVTRDGRVEVWDLEQSPLDPVISHQSQHKQMTCVSFSQDSPVVFAGGSDGTIDVYRIFGLRDPPEDNQTPESKAKEESRLTDILGGTDKHVEAKRREEPTTEDATKAADRLNQLLSFLTHKESDQKSAQANMPRVDGVMGLATSESKLNDTISAGGRSQRSLRAVKESPKTREALNDDVSTSSRKTRGNRR